jgi:hypothetical protein
MTISITISYDKFLNEELEALIVLLESYGAYITEETLTDISFDICEYCLGDEQDEMNCYNLLEQIETEVSNYGFNYTINKI